MNRIETDITVSAGKFRLNHHKVGDVIEIFSDILIRMSAIIAADDKVAGGSCTNPARNVSRERELAVVPLDINLAASVSQRLCSIRDTTHPLVLDIKVILANMVKEVLGMNGMQKRHRCSAIMLAKIHVK